jgi:hypothetical protein
VGAAGLMTLLSSDAQGNDEVPEDVVTNVMHWWGAVRVVALQVAFERQILKPVFYLIGYRLWV